jgi:hypothetical protein
MCTYKKSFSMYTTNIVQWIKKQGGFVCFPRMKDEESNFWIVHAFANRAKFTSRIVIMIFNRSINQSIKRFVCHSLSNQLMWRILRSVNCGLRTTSNTTETASIHVCDVLGSVSFALTRKSIGPLVVCASVKSASLVESWYPMHNFISHETASTTCNNWS